MNKAIIIFILLISACSGTPTVLPSESPNNVRLGIDMFTAFYASDYKNKNICLVTNHSGFDSSMKRNLDSLRQCGLVISEILAPEHGLSGFDEDYSSQKSYQDDKLKITIHNMHNYKPDELRNLLSRFDAVIFDIQDLGMRCYTYISNLREIIEALDGAKTKLVVLDRPNPLAPFGVSGFDLDESFKSRHVASFPAPLFYSLTIGEAALFYKAKRNLSTDIFVVKMKNYKKQMFFDSMNITWIPPSPNLPSYRSAVNYAALIYLEATNISVGRGTTKPFEYIGAPWINPDTLAEKLNSLKLECFIFKPVYFEPKYLVNKNQVCGGVHVIYKGGYFEPNEISFEILKALFVLYPDNMRWLNYGSRYHVDHLAGTDLLRKHIEKKSSFKELLKEMQISQKYFNSSMRKYLLY